MGDTNYTETEALLAVMDDDGGEERARELIASMFPTEVITLRDAAFALSELCAEDLMGR